MTEDEELVESVRATLDAAGIPESRSEARQIVHEVVRRGHPQPARGVKELARTRATGKPLAHVLGRVTFLGTELLADEGALVPRVETEILGRSALRTLADLRDQKPGRELRMIDMCCGSGNLACAIGASMPELRVWAADLTDGCVKLASRNTEHLGLAGRVTVHQGDLFAAMAGLGLEGTVDLVVCNPPYISTAKLGKERAELVDHEPREAFDGGPYGLSIHQRVIREAQPFLRDGGWLLFEMGLGQHRQLELLFRRAGGYEQLAWEHDAQQQPRVAKAQKKAGK